MHIRKPDTAPVQLSNTLFLRQNGRNVKVLLRDIVTIRANKNYTLLTIGSQTVWTLVSLLEWEQALSPREFCRIHRSHMIQLQKIEWFDHKEVRLFTGQQLPIGDEYRDRLPAAVTIVMPVAISKQPATRPPFPTI